MSRLSKLFSLKLCEPGYFEAFFIRDNIETLYRVKVNIKELRDSIYGLEKIKQKKNSHQYLQLEMTALSHLITFNALISDMYNHILYLLDYEKNLADNSNRFKISKLISNNLSLTKVEKESLHLFLGLRNMLMHNSSILFLQKMDIGLMDEISWYMNRTIKINKLLLSDYQNFIVSNFIEDKIKVKKFLQDTISTLKVLLVI